MGYLYLSHEYFTGPRSLFFIPVLQVPEAFWHTDSTAWLTNGGVNAHCLQHMCGQTNVSIARTPLLRFVPGLYSATNGCNGVWAQLITRCKAKPDCSPPDYSPSRLLIIVNWSVSWFRCVQHSTCTSCRTPPSGESHANPVLWIRPGFARTKLVASTTSLEE